MRSARLDALAALGATVGGRVNRTGDGAFILTYGGRQHQVANLRALAVVLQQICERVAERDGKGDGVGTARPTLRRAPARGANP